MARSLSAEKVELYTYFAMMAGCYAAMPESERQALHDWEDNVDQHQTSTSRWPGWEKYIGKRPSVQVYKAKPKTVIRQSLRTAVFERDGFACKSCGAQHDLSVDHIIPESKNGPTTKENLQTLCQPCNSRKGNRA